MPSVPFIPEPECSTGSQNLIWIPETDVMGTVADPLFARVAYENQADFFKYRAEDFSDPAVRAEFLEHAVFRASKAKKAFPVEDPRRYLFKTYAALVDEALAKSVKTVNTDAASLEDLSSEQCGPADDEITAQIYRQEILSAMPNAARVLWERRLLGYSFQEISEETHESADTLNARARRGAKEAFRRLFGH